MVRAASCGGRPTTYIQLEHPLRPCDFIPMQMVSNSPEVRSGQGVPFGIKWCDSIERPRKVNTTIRCDGESAESPASVVVATVCSKRMNEF